VELPELERTCLNGLSQLEKEIRLSMLLNTFRLR
jgi:hypothetical protein